MIFRKLVSGVCVAAAVGFLAACSGGSPAANTGGGQSTGGSTSGGGGGGTQAIQGVATPSSVSVVTATNAN
ncbi:MAG: hypothetical protein JWN85_3731 [Gammaproteobacteria bacterium]|nr:hypothetical protein [Gammaproteobacteria bacterium]